MMVEKYTQIILEKHLPANAIFTAESPSNIALIKYWGKKPVQIPTNPSLSFTLNNSKTKTKVVFSKQEKGKTTFKVFFEGKESDSFRPKIKKYLEVISPFCPWLLHYDLQIHTENSFPHSSGIASSASGMAALSQVIVAFEAKLVEMEFDQQSEKVSFLARLGSGSACRSVYPGLVTWGKHKDLPGSSDLYAQPLSQKVNPVFRNFQDSILLIHEGQKSVSSTVGHQLMNGHPYAEQRFASAHKNLAELLLVLEQGDLSRFGELVEHEALALHAMMMTSNPAFILMQPQTVGVLQAIWDKRKNTQIPVYFTLDAGANVHVLYPEMAKVDVREFIESELVSFTQNGGVIHDFSN